jgi:hypothetical protein
MAVGIGFAVGLLLGLILMGVQYFRHAQTEPEPPGATA